MRRRVAHRWEELQLPARSADSLSLDAFLVIAISTVLIIRVYLEMTNYPQLGGNGLHIAHVLWGGLGMLVAIALLLAFVSGSIKMVAAVAGGIGLGAFIDELGKFVTSDNNYFFQPTAAIVYVVFVVLFLAVRQLRGRRQLTPTERLLNAIEISKDMVTGRLSEAGKQRALALLEGAEPGNPHANQLRLQLRAYLPDLDRRTSIASAAAATGRWYRNRAAKRWFRRLIAVIFTLRALSAVLTFLYLLLILPLAATGNMDAQQGIKDLGGPTSWISVGASLIAGGLTIAGLISYRRSRLRAYHRFELAVLVNLLLAQPFNLLDTGFAGAVDIVFDLLLLASLGYMQAQERAGMQQSAPVRGPQPAAPLP